MDDAENDCFIIGCVTLYKHMSVQNCSDNFYNKNCAVYYTLNYCSR